MLTTVSVNIFTINEFCDISGNLLYVGASGQTNITESDFGTVTLMEIVVRIVVKISFHFC